MGWALHVALAVVVLVLTDVEAAGTARICRRAWRPTIAACSAGSGERATCRRQIGGFAAPALNVVALFATRAISVKPSVGEEGGEPAPVIQTNISNIHRR